MRWRDREGSENIEDRRDERSSRRGFRFPFPRGRSEDDDGDGEGEGGGLPRGIPTGSGGLGIVGVLVVLALAYFLGIDPRVILEGGDGGIPLPRSDGPREASHTLSAEEQELTQFTSVVLKATEEVWTEQFQRTGKAYTPPKLVLFRGDIDSGCGMGVAQMGPFYCPTDGKVYVDLSFYSELKNRFRAPGDFAQAYVVAHEIGHHVQTLLGTTEKVMRARSRAGETESNAIQVKMELQADCFAGLWANRAQSKLQVVEQGDIEEALNAAAAIGDDRIQKRTQGRVVPDAFTHGTSEQRATWFRRGFEAGDIKACDTFGGGV
jgi:predicted metalloprotease